MDSKSNKNNDGYKEGGLEPDRYIIQKSSGEQTDPDASYFVLRYDKDPHARAALRRYADSVRTDNPQFADDIADELSATRERFEHFMQGRMEKSK